MKIRPNRINTYLALTLLLCVATVTPGCQTGQSEKMQEASLRFHLETNLDGTDRTVAIGVGRTELFALSVETKAFLSEFNVERASVVNAPGGFAISVQFDREGGWVLDQYSTAHKGKRVAIAAEFGELRWIAAPIMRDRVSNGLLVFTSDTSREEAEKIVRGVNRVVELVRKGRK